MLVAHPSTGGFGAKLSSFSVVAQLAASFEHAQRETKSLMTSSSHRVSARRSTTRREERDEDAQIYQEMLNEAQPISGVDEKARPSKRRRVGEQLHDPLTADQWRSHSVGSPPDLFENNEEKLGDDLVAPQVVYNDSDESDESDANWEDVNIKAEGSLAASGQQSGDLSIVLDEKEPQGSTPSRKRRLGAVADQKARLEAHKVHLLSLLSHVHLRNHWCNSSEIQRRLSPLLSKQTLLNLRDRESESQVQRSHRLQSGLAQASQAFRSAFGIQGRGLNRPYWATDAESISAPENREEEDLPMEKADLFRAAEALEASRDVGAQLFCALLRSAGPETRLVCSLQILPLAPAARNTTANPGPTHPLDLVSAKSETEPQEEDSEDNAENLGTAGFQKSIRRSAIIGRIGRSTTSSRDLSSLKPSPRPSRQKPGRFKESAFPVFWVEAFDAAYQKWITVDPLVTHTIAKPSKIEPPASDTENTMSYVVAFEEDGSAVDVTRRYSKAYNAKTRRSRIESTKNGGKWWKRVMRLYKRAYLLDRDEIEASQLVAKEASEPMPKNVADFKDHPYYALERHLRRNEVIHPQREAGKVSVGNKALEPIFRRQDVHHVKSAHAWYRLGRDIKKGEVPLKWVQPRRKRAQTPEDVSDSEEMSGKPMFAGFQTCPYEPPPVIDGRVPRNIYGNIDIYVPSMVPAGGTHIEHSDAARAAKLLGINYADAVSGFEFKGRTGTAVVKGAVVAVEYQEAVHEVIRGFEYEREEAILSHRTNTALVMWKRLLTGLRIQERIEGYEIQGEKEAKRQETRESPENRPCPGLDTSALARDVPDNAGSPIPTENLGKDQSSGEDDIRAGGFFPEDIYGDELIDVDDDDDGGGFLPEDIDLE